MFRFADPWFLAAILLAAAPIAGEFLRERSGRASRVLYSEIGAEGRRERTARARAALLLPYAQALAIALAAVAWARPQAGQRIESVTTEGIDIIVALDVSGSMRAEDFAPKNRLYVAKKTIASFIEGRSADRIGLVTFSRVSQTRCPPTLDYQALETSLGAVTFAEQPEDGTAIGSGIATAVNRLRTSKAKSRVVILLTDGINNAGSIDPLTAADLARAVGVRMHAIGVGSEGEVTVPLPNGQRVRVELPINETELKKMAESTGGSYFRATDASALQEIFKKIDGMEKTKVEVLSYGRYEELFAWFLVPALVLMGAGFVGSRTLLARVP